MRTHRTMALAATLSIAAVAAVTDVLSGAGPAHAASAARPSREALAVLRSCESGGDYTADNGDTFYGAYQFMLGTWQSLGYDGYPHHAPPAVQDEAVIRLYQKSGWAPWPGCSEKHALAEMRTVSGPPLGEVGSAAEVVIAAVPMTTVAVVDELAAAAERRPTHSRFNQAVAEFG